MTVDHDDELLDALGQGTPVPSDDPLAGLFAAWRSEIDDSLPPLRLPAPESSPAPAALPFPAEGVPFPAEAAVPSQRRSLANSRWRRLGAAGSPPSDAPNPDAADDPDGAGSPGRHKASGPGRRWRVPRPALIGAVAAAMVFGGLTAATASAEPGSPFWPITQIMFSDKASSRVAEQEAISLLTQARQALAEDRKDTAAALITEARGKIALITDPAIRARLEAEAAAILPQVPALSSTVSPLPSNVEAPGVTPSPGTPTPSPQKSGLLPPILPSLLPSIPLPSLPLPLPKLPLLG
jgi:hypothetical protein